ncbi:MULTISPECIES: BCCT family transporter [Bacillaceae]|uniref:Choline transporter n=1 Tax=Alkalicoccobacillus plakortidis TaxID=444060 RepID=A0A9D5I3I1_9BACI|nr:MULTISPECIES: BCCT family transporter [Bacillaceae]KQL58973.1 choline transporter [Alkalicoccobacillus plakortidis]
MNRAKIDPLIFWSSVVVIIGASLLLVLNQAVAEPFLNDVMSGITTRMDWVFQFVTFGLFIVLGWLAFGPYGRVRLGEGKPEFSTFSWGAMLFCAGMGTSIMFWSVLEPLYYYTGPPFGLSPESTDAADWAVTYGLFHWGLSAWALYALPTVAIAYSFYVSKRPSLKISTALEGVLGKHSYGLLGKLIDILVIWSLVGGLGTSLGLGVPMVSAVIGDLIGVEQSLGLSIIIILFWTIIFSASSYLGLYKGIRKLSDINVYLALALAVFVLITGPTLFILSNFTNSLGLMLQNFIYMSFYTDPNANSGFPQTWTVFYWAWFAATAPFIGLFVARISRGRSIRQLILSILLWGTVGSWLYFAVFGGYAIHLETNQTLSLTEILATEGEQAVIVELLRSLPISTIVMAFFVILAFIFLATSLDSASYVLASIATKELKDEQEPARWHRVIWGFILSILAISLISVGALRVVQTSAVIVAVPVVVLYGLFTVSLIRSLKKDFPRGG